MSPDVCLILALWLGISRPIRSLRYIVTCKRTRPQHGAHTAKILTLEVLIMSIVVLALLFNLLIRKFELEKCFTFSTLAKIFTQILLYTSKCDPVEQLKLCVATRQRDTTSSVLKVKLYN